MLEGYPKQITLKDGANLTLRPMARDDQYALYNFFTSLSEEDRRFLRNDVTDRKLIEAWARDLDYNKILPILAEGDGKIVANATLHFQTFGWGRHLAEIRLSIAQELQGRGLGFLMLEEMSRLAQEHHVKHLLARIVTFRQGAIKAFQKAGFAQVSVLKNFVKDVLHQSYMDIALLVKELNGAKA
jgi:L-amino acid N-acyltransferase YncA